MAAAVSLQQPAHSQLWEAARSFCKMLYQIGNEEVKAATFIFENTILYTEYDKPKKLTLDEFSNGRRNMDGERVGPGCGINQRSHVNEALHRLEEGGHITVSSKGDKARRKNFYKLNLKCSLKGNIQQDTTPIPLSIVPQEGTDCSLKGNKMFPKEEQNVPQRGTRSEELPIVTLVDNPSRLATEAPTPEGTAVPVQPATPEPIYERVLETLHHSAGFKADKGKDLLLLKDLQHYPAEWLLEVAKSYAYADGMHNYNGFKGWVASGRAQDNLRKWEAARRAIEPVRFKTRKELDEEDRQISLMMKQEKARQRAQDGGMYHA